MSFALHELSSLLGTASSILGVVVSIDGTSARVATSSGVKLVQVSGQMKTGDRVTISDGIAVRTPTPTMTMPV